MTAADELRGAATRLRNLATAATPGPWSTDHGTQHGSRVGTADESNWVAWTGEWKEPFAKEDAEYAAAMGPAVGVALADWLESAAEDADQIGADPHALAVARTLLGDQP